MGYVAKKIDQFMRHNKTYNLFNIHEGKALKSDFRTNNH